MNVIKLFRTIMISLFLCIGPMEASANSKGVAKVLIMKGKVSAINPDGSTTQLKKGMWVTEGAKVQTQPKSFVKLLFTDKSQMNLGPKSEMKIEKFPKKKAGIISLMKGSLRSKVTKNYLKDEGKKSKLFVKTKSAAMGVRGTDFGVSITPAGGTNLDVISGAVSMAPISPGDFNNNSNDVLEGIVSSPKSVMVTKEQTTSVDPNSNSVPAPKKIPKNKLNALKSNDVPITSSSSNDKEEKQEEKKQEKKTAKKEEKKEDKKEEKKAAKTEKKQQKQEKKEQKQANKNEPKQKEPKQKQAKNEPKQKEPKQKEPKQKEPKQQDKPKQRQAKTEPKPAPKAAPKNEPKPQPKNEPAPKTAGNKGPAPGPKPANGPAPAPGPRTGNAPPPGPEPTNAPPPPSPGFTDSAPPPPPMGEPMPAGEPMPVGEPMPAPDAMMAGEAMPSPDAGMEPPPPPPTDALNPFMIGDTKIESMGTMIENEGGSTTTDAYAPPPPPPPTETTYMPPPPPPPILVDDGTMREPSSLDPAMAESDYNTGTTEEMKTEDPAAGGTSDPTMDPTMDPNMDPTMDPAMAEGDYNPDAMMEDIYSDGTMDEFMGDNTVVTCDLECQRNAGVIDPTYGPNAAQAKICIRVGTNAATCSN